MVDDYLCVHLINHLVKLGVSYMASFDMDFLFKSKLTDDNMQLVVNLARAKAKYDQSSGPERRQLEKEVQTAYDALLEQIRIENGSV